MKHSLIAIFSVALLAACGNEAPPRAAATQETQVRESAAPEPAAHSNITDDMLLGVWHNDAADHTVEFKSSPEGLLIFIGNNDGRYVPSGYEVEIAGNLVKALMPPMRGTFVVWALSTFEYNAANQTLVLIERTTTVPVGTVFRRVPQ